MFNIKKKGREKVERFQQGVKAHLSPIIAKYSERIRFGPRVRLANKWAKRHPKRLMFYYSTFAILLLAINFIIDFSFAENENTDVFNLSTMPPVSHRIQSLNRTEGLNDRVKSEVSELGNEGMKIYNELDSLMKLPVKTHADSVRIINNYNILKKTFNTNGHEL